jgi:hypothetical protein
MYSNYGAGRKGSHFKPKCIVTSALCGPEHTLKPPPMALENSDNLFSATMRTAGAKVRSADMRSNLAEVSKQYEDHALFLVESILATLGIYNPNMGYEDRYGFCSQVRTSLLLFSYALTTCITMYIYPIPPHTPYHLYLP